MRDILLIERRTYKDFAGAEEKIATNILTTRLNKLVQHELVTKRRDPNNRLSYLYEPTPFLMSLKPVLTVIAQWSNEHIENTYTLVDLMNMKKA